jgi:LPXTG-motif cell wall-anchored protein
MKKLITALLLVLFVASLSATVFAGGTGEIPTNWWPQQARGNTSFAVNADGSLSTDGGSGEYVIACGNPAQPAGDTTIEMELLPIDLTGSTLIGCLIGASNANDLYGEGIHLQISKDGGLKLFDVVPNQLTLTGVPTLGTDWVKVKFVIASGKLDFYVNGTKVLDQHTLAANPSGKWILIGASGLPTGTKASFRNILITNAGTTYENFTVAATNPQTGDAGSVAMLLVAAASAGSLILLRKKHN